METFGKLPVYAAIMLITGFTGCVEKDATIAYDVDMNKYEKHDFVEDSNTIIYRKALYDINEDLAFISAKNGITPTEAGTLMVSDNVIKDRISRNIRIINALVDDNKRQIAYLTAEVKKYKKGNSEMYQTLNENKKRLQAYELQLDAFKEELLLKSYTEDELNMIIDDLIVESELLRLQAQKYRTDLTTGYYVCQDKKELKRQGVLVEKGGVLGLGKTTVLNASAATENNFTPIDIHKVTDIPIHGEKPELVTEHPEGTYEFKKENNMVTYLHIQNPEKFWKTSKYMVVAVR